MAANAKVIDDAVADNTGSALRSRLETAPVGDVVGQETRPGTFTFSQPEFRVLEDGTALSAVTVLHADSYMEVVGLRNSLCDGTARLADGDYATTHLDLQFADGQISQTVGLAGALEKAQSVRDLCTKRFKDFHFGLKLIAQNSGQQEFVIDADAVQAPDKVLSDWVVASYRK